MTTIVCTTTLFKPLTGMNRSKMKLFGGAMQEDVFRCHLLPYLEDVDRLMLGSTCKSMMMAIPKPSLNAQYALWGLCAICERAMLPSSDDVYAHAECTNTHDTWFFSKTNRPSKVTVHSSPGIYVVGPKLRDITNPDPHGTMSYVLQQLDPTMHVNLGYPDMERQLLLNHVRVFSRERRRRLLVHYFSADEQSHVALGGAHKINLFGAYLNTGPNSATGTLVRAKAFVSTLRSYYEDLVLRAMAWYRDNLLHLFLVPPASDNLVDIMEELGFEDPMQIVCDNMQDPGRMLVLLNKQLPIFNLRVFLLKLAEEIGKTRSLTCPCVCCINLMMAAERTIVAECKSRRAAICTKTPQDMTALYLALSLSFSDVFALCKAADISSSKANRLITGVLRTAIGAMLCEERTEPYADITPRVCALFRDLIAKHSVVAIYEACLFGNDSKETVVAYIKTARKRGKCVCGKRMHSRCHAKACANHCVTCPSEDEGE